MKRMIVLVLGAFIILLCVMPAMAKQPGDTEENLPARGPDAAATIPSLSPEYPVIAPTGPLSTGVDKESPVLQGGAFSNYDTIFVHGVNAVVNSADSDVYYTEPHMDGLWTMVVPKTTAYDPNTILFCPIPSYQLKTGGVQPKVRYIAVQYHATGGAGIFANPTVLQVQVYNGGSPVRMIYTNFSSDTPAVRIIDLGDWYPFDRGLNIGLGIYSHMPSYDWFILHGYAARFEW